MEDYLIPASRYSTETHVANSKFIATISPVFSVEEAKEFILSIKQEHQDATHNVPIYLIGFGSSLIAHSSDDGEPSGTAGRPALAVLKGSGLGDTAIVITRYFGGTKLGTGGLVKAYSNAVRSIIKAVPKARKLLVHAVLIECPYNLYELLKKLILRNHGVIKDEIFTELVKISFTVPINRYDQLKESIINLSKGQIQLEITQTNKIALIPLSIY